MSPVRNASADGPAQSVTRASDSPTMSAMRPRAARDAGLLRLVGENLSASSRQPDASASSPM